MIDTRGMALRQAGSQAAASLAGGDVVAIPTDTVYGLAVRADDDDAVRKLFAVKRRRDDNPLPILIPHEDALTMAATGVPELARVLARHFWPGALTMVLPRAPAISDLVTGGKPTVGLRVPDHPVALVVLGACDFLVAVTSANVSARPAAREADEVRRDFAGKIETILADDRCPGGVVSTVVDLTGDQVRILRPGAISWAQIQTALSAS